jgi:pyrimidine-specific ribonucleoside hydrolase
MLDIHFDMETQDPDDVMTLAVLATHPRVMLMSVSTTPGGRDQVGLVKHVLRLLGRGNVAVGGNPEREKPAVSGFHDKWLGSHSADPTHTNETLLDMAAKYGCTLLTGAPLKNLHKLPPFKRWVAQGGFAGDSVVPPQYRLSKFEGKETCPTFNFGGAPYVALGLLASPNIREKILVSKNVCHGLAWDRAFHERVKALPRRTAGLDLVVDGMGLYLKKNPDGKKLHDPLAMTVAIDPEVCEFRRVEMYRQKNEWGARLKPDSDIQISVALNRDRFFRVLTET